MKIREAVKEDLPVILEIMNDAILNSTAIYDYNARTCEYVNNWFAKKQSDNFPVIVGELEGKIIGFGSYGIFRAWDAYKFSAEHSIYIANGFRGCGRGGELLERLIALAKHQGFHTLIAGIDAENEGSCKFHSKFGFVEVGRLREVGYKFDRWLDLIFMQLLL
ncbi:GNAT family N-acetyltransferase [Segetibacter koreensis]|uniref:GNAT family N-acetyltransferase n=1 Tax=Segetibacter koreensis TaxID=398037 RepID=UPI00035E558A|nr:GNAT family N-acetyltransferase [Segetibacter koreensis]